MPVSVAFPSAEFDALPAMLRERLDARQGTCLLVVGEGDARHVALGRLMDALHLPFSLVPLDALYAERTALMVANLREAFDQAGTSPTILGFDYAGVTMDRVAHDDPHDAFTPTDYLFERAKTFRGLVVVCVRRSDLADAVASHVNVVVRV